MRALRFPIAAALTLGLAGCAGRVAQSTSSAPAVTDIEGRLHTPLAPDEGCASVLFFVMTDCPIANAYAPEIQAVIADHDRAPLDFYLVYVDPPEVGPAAVREHAREYGHRGPLLVDADQTLARRLGVTRTPEVAVISAGGERSYLGRIDDRYRELARRRPNPTRRDLRDHLQALLAGNTPAPVKTEAVGCLLPDPPLNAARAPR